MAQQAESGTKTQATEREVPAAPEMERVDDVPVGVQLAWRLRALIISGQLPAGEKLPGVRDLAAAASVNVNTARAVYHRLEREGLAITQQGLGTFVSLYPPVSPALEQVAADAIESAVELGVNPRELARTIYAASLTDDLLAEAADTQALPPDPFDEAHAEQAPADAAAARRTLQGQIATLEAQLAAYPEERTREEDAPEVPAPPRLVGIDELEATRDELVERLKRAQRSAKKQTAQYNAARGRLEQMVADPESHKWEIVDREELGDEACGRWEVRPAWGPVGALMNWWRVKLSSGCP
jgi:DNA-binding transcriptional regulator YhcF (GntR family)